MSESLPAALFAVVLWWLTTGLVLVAVRRLPAPRSTVLTGATLVLLLGMAGLHVTRDDTSSFGAYAAFVSILLVWSWHEISFLTGLVTGPRTTPAPPSEAHGRAPLRSAIETLIYHELAILISFAAVLALTYGGANTVGLLTFIVLWVMRLSAKFNLYLGVPNLGEAFLPARLSYLGSYFCRRPMNFLFPLSVTLGTAAALYLGSLGLAADADDHTRTGYALVTTLLILAVVEHWFMVLPFDSTAVWSWGIPNRTTAADDTVASQTDPTSLHSRTTNSSSNGCRVAPMIRGMP